MNLNYGHLTSPDSRLVYAGDNAIVDGVRYSNPSREMYARCTPPELPIVDNPAPSDPPAGYHYEFSSHEVAENVKVKMENGKWVEAQDGIPLTVVRSTYTLVQDPPPSPRRWTRLALKTALAQAEMLGAAKAYLQAQEIATGYTAWEALTDADYIEEGYPTAEKWDALLDGAAVALGKTRALIDAFLDTVPAEGGV